MTSCADTPILPTTTTGRLRLLGLGRIASRNRPLGTATRTARASPFRGNAEVTVADLPPTESRRRMPGRDRRDLLRLGLIAVGRARGDMIPGGILVTMRWDLSELPKGMTPQKLRIAHLLGGRGFEQVNAPCVFDGGRADEHAVHLGRAVQAGRQGHPGELLPAHRTASAAGTDRATRSPADQLNRVRRRPALTMSPLRT